MQHCKLVPMRQKLCEGMHGMLIWLQPLIGLKFEIWLSCDQFGVKQKLFWFIEISSGIQICSITRTRTSKFDRWSEFESDIILKALKAWNHFNRTFRKAVESSCLRSYHPTTNNSPHKQSRLTLTLNASILPLSSCNMVTEQPGMKFSLCRCKWNKISTESPSLPTNQIQGVRNNKSNKKQVVGAPPEPLFESR